MVSLTVFSLSSPVCENGVDDNLKMSCNVYCNRFYLFHVKFRKNFVQVIALVTPGKSIMKSKHSLDTNLFMYLVDSTPGIPYFLSNA